MSEKVIGEFDSEEAARAAIARLGQLGIRLNSIETYPSLVEPSITEPSSADRVKGAETPVSGDGPLGHLGAIIVKLFHIAQPDATERGGLEPTRELNTKTPVFVSVHLGETSIDVSSVELALDGAGASRVARHAE